MASGGGVKVWKLILRPQMELGQTRFAQKVSLLTDSTFENVLLSGMYAQTSHAKCSETMDFTSAVELFKLVNSDS